MLVYSVHMRRSLLFATLLVVGSTFASATPAGAQAASAPVQAKTVQAPRAAPSSPPPTRYTRADTAHASKSVSEKLFDAHWVLFPARLALVIVFLTIALLLLMFGAWSVVRVAHSLRHMKWGQPPRRLKRGELGAAGTSFAVEWEERMHENLEQDAERDRQIAALHETVAGLSKEHDELAAMVAALLQRHPEVEGNGPETQS